MDTTALKAKVKEKKDKAVEIWHRHWKKILFGTGVVVGLVVAYNLSSNDNDEKNGDEDDGNFDSNSYGELDEGSDSQTCIPRNYPKREIGGIDVTGSRLTEKEKQFLEELSAKYDRFKGKEQTVVRDDVGISSDGKYTSQTKTKFSFAEDKPSINVHMSYEDDCQAYESTYTIDKGRDIINFVRDNKNLKMFDDVQDTMDIL